MQTFNVHEAKTHFSRLLDLVQEGEPVVITRNGAPVAELVPARRKPFPFGIAANDPNVNREVLLSDDWWQPMTEDEVEEFLFPDEDKLGDVK